MYSFDIRVVLVAGLFADARNEDSLTVSYM